MHNQRQNKKAKQTKKKNKTKKQKRTWLNEAYIAIIPFAKSARAFICCHLSSDFVF